MPHFTGIGFYDLSAFFASYTGRHKRGLVESVGAHHHKVRMLGLLDDREQSPVLKEWNSAKALLQRIEAQLRTLPKPAELVNAYVLAFDPGGYEQWNTEDLIDPSGFMRIRVLLNPCPTFRLHSGEESFIPQPWMPTVVDHRQPCSATNFNAPLTAHELVLEMALDVEPPMGAD